jgi:DNA-binding NarL/FixJ family response regulator
LFALALRAAVASDGLEVVGVAETGREAVDLAVEFAPDVLLLDLEMPELDGFDVLERLQECGSLPSTIVLTGSDRKDGRKRAAELGAVGFLTKVQSMDEVIDAVRTAAVFVRAFHTPTLRDDA